MKITPVVAIQSLTINLSLEESKILAKALSLVYYLPFYQLSDNDVPREVLYYLSHKLEESIQNGQKLE